jgi:hypothetical protein
MKKNIRLSLLPLWELAIVVSLRFLKQLPVMTKHLLQGVVELLQVLVFRELQKN